MSYRHAGAAAPAVDGLSFAAREGTITGLLGPNGAGKTTFVSVLCGVRRPQLGEVRIFGQEGHTRLARRSVGYCPQELALYTTLSARENLRFFGRMAGIRGAELDRRVDWCLDAVRLSSARNQRVEEYSGGMQRRLNLATALVHAPRLLVLDEPTVGVDMTSRHAIFETLELLCAGGTAILYTTHYLEEVERLCEDVVVIDKGRLLVACPTADLVGSGLHRQRFRLSCVDGGADGVAADLVGRGFGAEAKGRSLVDASGDSLEGLLQVFARLVAAGSVTSVESKNPSLEERFLEITRERKGER